jgi:hypothetical protein
MRGSQRPDPKKRIKPEDLKALAIKKVFSKGKEAREALLAKIRTLNGVEKRHAIHSILNDADMDHGVAVGEHVPNYQSIFVESLNWQDFISIEDHPELYEEIETALLCEADPDDSPEPPPQSPTMFMEDDDQETEHIVCPFCWYVIEESFCCYRPSLTHHSASSCLQVCAHVHLQCRHSAVFKLQQKYCPTDAPCTHAAGIICVKSPGTEKFSGPIVRQVIEIALNLPPRV